MGVKGSKFWEARSSHGRKPIYATPEAMWSAATEYFEWVEDNPLWETKATQYQGVQVDMTVSKMRAMTIQACCRFMGIGAQTLDDYGDREDFSGIVKEIKLVIYDQKFTGAAAELLNSNIIARELGLSDRKDHNVSGEVTTFNMNFGAKPTDADD